MPNGDHTMVEDALTYGPMFSRSGPILKNSIIVNHVVSISGQCDASKIVQSLYFLNPIVQAPSHLL